MISPLSPFFSKKPFSCAINTGYETVGKSGTPIRILSWPRAIDGAQLTNMNRSNRDNRRRLAFRYEVSLTGKILDIARSIDHLNESGLKPIIVRPMMQAHDYGLTFALFCAYYAVSSSVYGLLIEVIAKVEGPCQYSLLVN